MLRAHEQAGSFAEQPAVDELAGRPLQRGDRLGPYEIVALLGVGGMGEVYQARDTRLDRTVAIKVLRAHLASDPTQRARFEREARLISQLNHPHICTLYDVGRDDGTDYLVVECLNGQTLAQRLRKGGLPMEQALTIAIQIAGALDAAHRVGIIHRDLKPANVMLTKAGAKLLDFGLARMMSVAAATGVTRGASQGTLTGDGMLLGTVPYMAPEQLEGRDADTRSDIFAFGCVLYEMVIGRRAFEGDTHASVIAAIMSSDPPAMATSQPATPPGLDHLVRCCLAKDQDERWQTIGDVMRQLQWLSATAGTNPSTSASSDLPRRRIRERVAWIATAVLACATIAFAACLYLRQVPPDGGAQRLSVLPPADATLSRDYLALSPDGRLLAFVATGAGGHDRLWIRSLDALVARPVAGTEDARNPFWSPDGRYVAFFTQKKLKKIRPTGGSAQEICDAPLGSGGAWNSEGVILFSPDAGSAIYRVAADGGVASPVTTLDRARGEAEHSAPAFLPDGRHFLYTSMDVSTRSTSRRSTIRRAGDSSMPTQARCMRRPHRTAPATLSTCETVRCLHSHSTRVNGRSREKRFRPPMKRCRRDSEPWLRSRSPAPG